MTEAFLQFAEAKKRPHIVVSPKYTTAHKHDSMTLCTFATTASSRRQTADTAGTTASSIYDAPHRPDDAIANIIALEMGITAIVAAVGGGLDQFPGDSVSFRSATSGRFGLHLGKERPDFIDRHAFSTHHILLVLLRGCDFGCNVDKFGVSPDARL